MSLIDKMVAAVTPPESEQKRRAARAKALAVAGPNDWLAQVGYVALHLEVGPGDVPPGVGGGLSGVVDPAHQFLAALADAGGGLGQQVQLVAGGIGPHERKLIGADLVDAQEVLERGDVGGVYAFSTAALHIDGVRSPHGTVLLLLAGGLSQRSQYRSHAVGE